MAREPSAGVREGKPLARKDQIKDPKLKALIDEAHGLMRRNQPTEAMHGLVAALYRLLELKPELATEQLEPRPGWKMPFLTRWPQYGANWKDGSLDAGKPEIEYVRDRFALSEAITCYEFLLDTAIAREA